MDQVIAKTISYLHQLNNLHKRKCYTQLIEYIQKEKYDQQTHMIYHLLNLYNHEKCTATEKTLLEYIFFYLEPILFAASLEQKMRGLEKINEKYNDYKKSKL